MGSFRWPSPVSSREVDATVDRWRSQKPGGAAPKKLRSTPKNLHRSRDRRRKLANERYMRRRRGKDVDARSRLV